MIEDSIIRGRINRATQLLEGIRRSPDHPAGIEVRLANVRKLIEEAIDRTYVLIAEKENIEEGEE